jgi:hypothetical protein
LPPKVVDKPKSRRRIWSSSDRRSMEHEVDDRTLDLRIPSYPGGHDGWDDVARAGPLFLRPPPTCLVPRLNYRGLNIAGWATVAGMSFVSGDLVVDPVAPSISYIVLEVDDRVMPPLMRVVRKDKKPMRNTWMSQEGWVVSTPASPVR